MRISSTEFRKNLFQIVERVLQGELVEVAHKGRLIRLVPQNKPTKLSRLTQRETISGTFEELELAQRQLEEEIRASLESNWDNN